MIRIWISCFAEGTFYLSHWRIQRAERPEMRVKKILLLTTPNHLIIRQYIQKIRALYQNEHAQKTLFSGKVGGIALPR